MQLRMLKRGQSEPLVGAQKIDLSLGKTIISNLQGKSSGSRDSVSSLTPNNFPSDWQAKVESLVQNVKQNPTIIGSFPRAGGRTKFFF